MAEPTQAVEVINWVKVASALAAGLCMGLGSLGPSLGQGFIGGKACENIGKKPDNAGPISRTMLIAMTFTESSSIYALMISLILLFVFAK